MAEEISTLVLKVDLNCPKCYNKIRQVLCKFKCEIQSKTFDESNNTVIITGFFCPCKFSKKLCCKAGKVIQSIEIIKHQNDEDPISQPEPKKLPADEPPIEVPQPDPPIPEPQPQLASQKQEPPAPVEPEPEPQPKIAIPYFPAPPPQFGVCCGPCYEGYGGGPCHQGHGIPLVPPAPFYDYYYGRRPPPPAAPCNCGCGGYSRRCAAPCDYFTEENPASCTIM